MATIPLRAKSPASIAAPTVSTAGTTSKDETLTVGVVPNIFVTALQTQYENCNRYLDRVGNKQKVRIVVPANFKAFFDRSMLGDYDLAIAAPNLARAAQLDRNLTLLVSDKPRIAANMVTLSAGGIVNPRAIQGKPLAFANSQSSVAMYGQQWLSADLKLEAGRNYEVEAARTDLGAGRTVLAGEAAAAIMGQGKLRSLPANETTRIRMLGAFARAPNFIFLAHPRLGRDQTTRLRTLLNEFLADTTDCAVFA